jgi:hypothetical protein
MRRRVLFCVLLIIWFPLWGDTQIREESSQLPPNAIHATIGSVYATTAAFLCYEFRLLPVFGLSMADLRLRIGAGAGLVILYGAGPLGTVGLQVLTGKCDHRFEAGLGIGVFIYGNRWVTPLPAVNTGYRYQKPGTAFILRCGVGFPEGIYLSAGYAF